MTEITDITTPGKEGAFTVGSRGTVKGPGDLPPDHLRLIEGAVTATVGTYDSKGIARLTPMWWGTDGDHIHINTKKGRLKYKNLINHPEVSIQAIDPENPYHWMTVYGRVVDMVDEEDAGRGYLATESIDDFAEVYLGERPYPFREKDEVRVLFYVKAEKIVTFGGE
ncbi:pyridoxamine 5'-phosphate oxidase family protein [Rubrobacter indicoceani]|uniref:pyridoxamine 5'-phosphate oxidase family protein n=1 Tax=Rubrobacter indicoceani TaxID=2051957 RepID=UPI000E5B13C1|nr:pyridoxamine 5'-phosphate oxidase family protein [Rubrobacter indicoceani]